jgi:hypothetical protein
VLGLPASLIRTDQKYRVGLSLLSVPTRYEVADRFVGPLLVVAGDPLARHPTYVTRSFKQVTVEYLS